jgi:hypothetical protein
MIAVAVKITVQSMKTSVKYMRLDFYRYMEELIRQLKHSKFHSANMSQWTKLYAHEARFPHQYLRGPKCYNITISKCHWVATMSWLGIDCICHLLTIHKSPIQATHVHELPLGHLSSFSFCEHLTSQLYLENPPNSLLTLACTTPYKGLRSRGEEKLPQKGEKLVPKLTEKLAEGIAVTASHLFSDSSHVQRASSLSLLRYWLHQLPNHGKQVRNAEKTQSTKPVSWISVHFWKQQGGEGEMQSWFWLALKRGVFLTLWIRPPLKRHAPPNVKSFLKLTLRFQVMATCLPETSGSLSTKSFWAMRPTVTETPTPPPCFCPNRLPADGPAITSSCSSLPPAC